MVLSPVLVQAFLAYLCKIKPSSIQPVRGWCVHSSVWSLTFKESFLFRLFVQGNVLLSMQVIFHHRPTSDPLYSLDFPFSECQACTFPNSLQLRRPALGLARGHAAAPSVSMASSCPPAVSRSFTVPPCGLRAQPTRLCLWCGGARALSAVPFLRCWITLGPARSLHQTHNSPLLLFCQRAVYPVP